MTDFIEKGHAPALHELSHMLGMDPGSAAAGLRHLKASHGIVCHPGEAKPWVIHPFSLTPTATWVQAKKQGWCAPCIWCALGIAALVNEDIIIHTRIADETEDIDIHVDNAAVYETRLVARFAIPLRAAWTNVHRYCATMLPFKAGSDVDAWCERHRIRRGAVVVHWRLFLPCFSMRRPAALRTRNERAPPVATPFPPAHPVWLAQ